MTWQIAILLGTAVMQFSFGTLAYVRDTLRGESKPNRMTFFIWAAGPFIAVAAGFSAGGGWAMLPAFMSGFGPLCIFLASFKNPKAYWKLGLLDYTCGALAVLALVLWAFTKNPFVAIVLAIAADALALLPTVIKGWKYPETETGAVYIFALFGACVGVVLSNGRASELLFLGYLVVSDIALITAVYHHRLLAALRRA